MTAVPAGFSTALGDGSAPVAAREAASVLVLDTSARPFRLLMMRRPRGADFAPGAWVFPGGSVSPEDATQPDVARAAALRELWEEMGLLLAAKQGEGARLRVTSADSGRVLQQVAAGADFWSALTSLGLRATPERLVLVTRWITPASIRRRYDTRFFAVRAPRQTVVPEEGEVVDWAWVTAAEALGGRVELVYATRRILELIAPEADGDRVLRLLRRRRERAAVEPEIVTAADGAVEIRDRAGALFR